MVKFPFNTWRARRFRRANRSWEPLAHGPRRPNRRGAIGRRRGHTQTVLSGKEPHSLGARQPDDETDLREAGEGAGCGGGCGAESGLTILDFRFWILDSDG